MFGNNQKCGQSFKDYSQTLIFTACWKTGNQRLPVAFDCERLFA